MTLLRGAAVVVPWDYSDLAKKALAEAIRIVEHPEAVRLIHVATMPDAMYPGNVWDKITEETISEHAQREFEKYALQEKLPELSFTTMFGDPGSVVADFASSANAELIIIPSHGHTGLKRLFLGSVAERVIRLAHCNVLVLKDL